MLESQGSGGRGSGPQPPEKSQNIGFLGKTGLNSLKFTKHSMLGHHRHATETHGVSLADRKWLANSGILILPPLIKFKKKKKMVSKLEPLRQNFLDPRMTISFKMASHERLEFRLALYSIMIQSVC